MPQFRSTVALVLCLPVLTILPVCIFLSMQHTVVRDQRSFVISKDLESELENYYYRNSLDKLHDILETVLETNESNPRAAFEQVIALSSLLPKIRNISRIKTPSPEAFRSYIAPVGLPVIFTDMLDKQPLARWSWDYVKTRWGDHVFHNTRQGNYSDSKTTKSGKYFVNRVSVRLSDFIDIVTGKKPPSKGEEGLYITKQKVIPREALETEFYYPPFYPGSHRDCYLEPTGWIGAPGTFTQGHIDSKDNFVYQVIGEKRWTIFSPVDYKYLYYTKGKGSLEWSAVMENFEKPNLKKFPLFSKATPITFTMKPGEVLYLPRGWTHFVENVTPALMINTWRYGPAAITWFWSEKNKKEIMRRCFQ